MGNKGKIGNIMRGYKSYCRRCGVGGSKLGCPSWFDECKDSTSCADRCREKADRAERRVKELEKQLEEKCITQP